MEGRNRICGCFWPRAVRGLIFFVGSGLMIFDPPRFSQMGVFQQNPNASLTPLSLVVSSYHSAFFRLLIRPPTHLDPALTLVPIIELSFLPATIVVDVTPSPAVLLSCRLRAQIRLPPLTTPSAAARVGTFTNPSPTSASRSIEDEIPPVTFSQKPGCSTSTEGALAVIRALTSGKRSHIIPLQSLTKSPIFPCSLSTAS